MAVAQTSLFAYLAVKGELRDKQQKVYEALQDLGQATNEEISNYLHWPINRVTGRVTELHRMNYVGVDGLRRGPSGHSAKVWSLRNPNDKKLLEQDCED